MKKRIFHSLAVALVFSILLAPPAAQAQRRGKAYRVGYLDSTNPTINALWLSASGTWMNRRTERFDRVPLGRRQGRATQCAGGRTGEAPGGRHCHFGKCGCAGRAGGKRRDSDRCSDIHESGCRWLRRNARPAGREHHGPRDPVRSARRQAAGTPERNTAGRHPCRHSGSSGCQRQCVRADDSTGGRILGTGAWRRGTIRRGRRKRSGLPSPRRWCSAPTVSSSKSGWRARRRWATIGSIMVPDWLRCSI